jgi:hypothetical protein
MHMRALITTAAVLCLMATTVAQDEPKTNFLTQATVRLVIPEGETESTFWEMQREYFDKVINKSKLVVHYTICRHAWGSEGATAVESIEYANWSDIETFNRTERKTLEEAAWPDEAARKAFMKKWRSFENPYHKDEIYNISLSMRK